MGRPSAKSIQSLLVILILAGFASGAFATERKPEDPKPGAEATVLLRFMAEYLAGARQLQVKITSGYDVVQSTGQKIEFREAREVTLVRPDRLRIDVVRDDGRKNLVLFDGSTLSVYDFGRKVLATAARPGDIDAAVMYFVRDLKMRLPLALLLTAGLPAEIEGRVRSAEVVQRVALFDVPCVQVAARADNVDFQVWIPEQGAPLPRRIVITYRNEPGQPQFWADLSQWSLAPDPPDSTFAFTPPEGTERVSFLAEIAKPTGPPRKKGGRK